MAIFKNEEARELQELQKVQARIQRSERRERIHHVLIAGLGALLLASIAVHIGSCGKCKSKKFKI